MKRFFLPALLALFLSSISWADDIAVSSEKDPEQRLKMIPLESILVPNKTPFDADPTARKIYVDEYRIAYRTVLAEVFVGCYMSVQGPYQKAMDSGNKDGLAAARQKYPEKAARALGMSLEDYRKAFPEKK
jgi:hypothetical protein